MIQIVNPASKEQLNEVRNLILEFVQWHRQRNLQDIALIDEYFDADAFEEELASLPGKYSPPKGSLLLALYDNQPAGCVALRQIDPQTCEMKRMFLYTHFHGKGIGRALAERIIDDARAIGYSTMKLVTSFRQVEALGLYKRMGFTRINPYYEVSESMKNWLVFMEMQL